MTEAVTKEYSPKLLTILKKIANGNK